MEINTHPPQLANASFSAGKTLSLSFFHLRKYANQSSGSSWLVFCQVTAFTVHTLVVLPLLSCRVAKDDLVRNIWELPPPSLCLKTLSSFLRQISLINNALRQSTIYIDGHIRCRHLFSWLDYLLPLLSPSSFHPGALPSIHQSRMGGFQDSHGGHGAHSARTAQQAR